MRDYHIPQTHTKETKSGSMGFLESIPIWAYVVAGAGLLILFGLLYLCIRKYLGKKKGKTKCKCGSRNIETIQCTQCNQSNTKCLDCDQFLSKCDCVEPIPERPMDEEMIPEPTLSPRQQSQSFIEGNYRKGPRESEIAWENYCSPMSYPEDIQIEPSQVGPPQTEPPQTGPSQMEEALLRIAKIEESLQKLPQQLPKELPEDPQSPQDLASCQEKDIEDAQVTKPKSRARCRSFLEFPEDRRELADMTSTKEGTWEAATDEISPIHEYNKRVREIRHPTSRPSRAIARKTQRFQRDGGINKSCTANKWLRDEEGFEPTEQDYGRVRAQVEEREHVYDIHADVMSDHEQPVRESKSAPEKKLSARMRRDFIEVAERTIRACKEVTKSKAQESPLESRGTQSEYELYDTKRVRPRRESHRNENEWEHHGNRSPVDRQSPSGCCCDCVKETGNDYTHYIGDQNMDCQQCQVCSCGSSCPEMRMVTGKDIVQEINRVALEDKMRKVEAFDGLTKRYPVMMSTMKKLQDQPVVFPCQCTQPNVDCKFCRC